MQISVAPYSTASCTRRSNSARSCSYASGERLPWPKPQNAQPTMQTFDTLMLRFTTNVTVSPASSRAQLVRGLAHVLDRLGARLREHRRQLVGPQRHAVARAWRSRPAPGRCRIGRSSRRPEPRRGMKLQYFDLDHVEHALLDPVRVHVLRVDAEPLGERVALRRQLLAHPVHATGTGARARCGRRWRTGRRGRWRPPPRAAATSRTGSAGSARPRRASAARHSRTSDAHVVERRPRAPSPAAGSSSPCVPVRWASSAISAGSAP